MRCALSVLAASIAAAALVGAPVAFSSAPARVMSVYDGDTLTLTDGQKVRLLQVDTPELGSGECYSRVAHRVLLSLVPPGTLVTLESDPALDRVDRFGRLLRYVLHGGLNVNLELVRRGAAAPYFYKGERGRYAGALMRAAQSAKATRRGLWGACPRTQLDPDRQVDTGVSGPPAKSHMLVQGDPLSSLHSPLGRARPGSPPLRWESRRCRLRGLARSPSIPASDQRSRRWRLRTSRSSRFRTATRARPTTTPWSTR